MDAPHCAYCSAPFEPGRRGTKQYCTATCRILSNRKLGQRRAISYANCSECNHLFIVRRAARATDATAYKVCRQPDCMTARREKRNLDWAASQQPYIKTDTKRRGLTDLTCVRCASDYRGRKGSKYCSRFCSQATTRDKYAGASDKGTKRRAERQRLAEVEPVDRIYIFTRDRWTCHLCNTRINPKLKFPHPMSPSLDHLIPLAQHGAHEPANVSAAHLRCNIRKGDRGQAEQLALIG